MTVESKNSQLRSCRQVTEDNNQVAEEIEEVVESEEEIPPAEEEEEEEPGDELEALQQELEGVKAKEAEYLDGWQRARAELANARKRFERERVQAYTNAKADILARLLPIVDDLERAFDTLPDNLSHLTWIEGIALIQRRLQLLLEQDGVTPIEALEQEFDPFLHQAVTHEPSETVPVGHVISELQKGYRVGDRVLRPSMVRVSAGPPPPPESEAEAETVEPESQEDQDAPVDEGQT
jgi:molecular chaperone GrpE